MLQEQPATAHSELLDILKKGDEQEARKFLTDHFAEFPEDLQGEIATGFFEEGLGRVATEKKLLGEFQDNTSQFMAHMDRLARILEDKKKLLELEEKIK